jgi:hypothetical protein
MQSSLAGPFPSFTSHSSLKQGWSYQLPTARLWSWRGGWTEAVQLAPAAHFMEIYSALLQQEDRGKERLSSVTLYICQEHRCNLNLNFSLNLGTSWACSNHQHKSCEFPSGGLLAKLQAKQFWACKNLRGDCLPMRVMRT